MFVARQQTASAIVLRLQRFSYVLYRMSEYLVRKLEPVLNMLPFRAIILLRTKLVIKLPQYLNHQLSNTIKQHH